MIFNSFEYAVFLAIVLVLYYSLATGPQNTMLLLASYVFYGWWDYRFLALLWISTLVDFHCAAAIGRSTSSWTRGWLLIVSCATNLGMLAFFKYFNFFSESSVAVLETLGISPGPVLLNVVLPMGISFYTFQTLSYTIDVYRRELPPSRSLKTFALYVAYFPQLVAGPIERAARLLPQLSSPRTVTVAHVHRGAFLILLGVFKKVGVADAVAPMVDARFNSPTIFEGPDLLFGVYLFAIQIYCDFSGYSDIARGTSKLLGIDLVVNFRQPYFASSITEFWHRWHVSLSSWLRDYLYIPLGGNRGGRLTTFRNLFITMLLGGLWHGASWAFVFWGGLHGAFLAVHRRFRVGGVGLARFGEVAGRAVGMFCTFQIVCFAWIFFRASSFSIAWTMIGRIVSWETLIHFPEAPWVSGRLVVLVSVLLAIDIGQARFDDECFLFRFPAVVRGVCYGVLVVLTLTLGGVDASVPFIYFQF